MGGSRSVPEGRDGGEKGRALGETREERKEKREERDNHNQDERAIVRSQNGAAKGRGCWERSRWPDAKFEVRSAKSALRNEQQREKREERREKRSQKRQPEILKLGFLNNSN